MRGFFKKNTRNTPSNWIVRAGTVYERVKQDLGVIIRSDQQIRKAVGCLFLLRCFSQYWSSINNTKHAPGVRYNGWDRQANKHFNISVRLLSICAVVILTDCTPVPAAQLISKGMSFTSADAPRVSDIVKFGWKASWRSAWISRVANGPSSPNNIWFSEARMHEHLQ